MGLGRFFLYAYVKPLEDLKKTGNLLKGVVSDLPAGADKSKGDLPEDYKAAIAKRAKIARNQLPFMMRKIKSRMMLILATLGVVGLWGAINLLIFAVDLKIFLTSSAPSMPYDTLVTVMVCMAIGYGLYRWLYAERMEYQDTEKQMKVPDEALLMWIGDMSSTYKTFLFFKRILLGSILVMICFGVAAFINMNFQQLVISVSVSFFLFCMNIKYSLYMYQIKNEKLCSLGDYLQNAGKADLLNPEL